MIKVDKIYFPDDSTRHELPLYSTPVSAGFPSPAEDYLEGRLDLNKHLIKNPAATFFVRVSGESMKDAGIHTGDILIVDRSIEPQNNAVVIAVVNGDFTVKRISRKNGKLFLMPENDEFKPIEIKNDSEFEVWGVVTNVIHKL